MTTDDIKLAETYRTHCGLTLSTVSTYAAGDGKWLAGIAAGEAGCTLRKAHRVVQWFADHWPTELDWPREIRRPRKSKPEAA